MTDARKPYVEFFVDRFKHLTSKQRARLREHARRGTKICCGPRASFFFADEAG